MTVGRTVTADEIERLLTPLEFGIRRDGQLLDVTVPSYRATKDVTMEADVVEEIARIIGYGSIEPRLPTVTVRYAPPDAAGSLERRALELLCGGMSYAEVHRYIWFEDNWLATLGYDPGPTVRLRNPAACAPRSCPACSPAPT
jgi:phenylalanyl-tRNA synthetase beta chain